MFNQTNAPLQQRDCSAEDDWHPENGFTDKPLIPLALFMLGLGDTALLKYAYGFTEVRCGPAL